MKISLGYYKSTVDGVKTMIPYWFTRERNIYLNTENPSIEIDPSKYPKSSLIQIYNASVYGDLIVENAEELLQYINETKEDENPEIAKEVKPAFETKSKKELDEEKEEKRAHALSTQAQEILDNNFTFIKNKVGSSKLEDDGSLQEGIANVELLEKMLELEKKSDDPRVSVISVIEKRIKAIEKSNGFMRTEDEIPEVKAEELVKENG